MSHVKWWTFVTSLLLLIPTAAVSSEVPEWIGPPTDRAPTPIWATARAMTTPAGELRNELLIPYQAKRIQRHLDEERKARAAAGLANEEAANQCHNWIYVPPNPEVEEPTLEGLMAHARLAFVGTVLDRQEGFYHGHPNSLLEIRVDKVLKAPEGQEEITSVLATFPHVEMRVGNEMICMRSDRYPERPLTGKGIMVFTVNIPDTDPLIVAPNTETVLFETESGATSLPARLGDVLDPPAWSSIVEEAIDLAGSTGIDPILIKLLSMARQGKASSCSIHSRASAGESGTSISRTTVTKNSWRT